MYGYNFGYQYPQYGVQNPMPDNLAQLRMSGSQMQTPVMAAPAASQNNSNSLIWVQGEAGAKSYLVAPNATVMLMDSEGDRFYLKSADASGMPLPLRVFEYKERSALPQQAAAGHIGGDGIDLGKFVTREELEQRLAAMTSKNNLTEGAENG